MSGLHLTRELGLFDRHGLNVRFAEINSSRQAAPLLAGGRLDVLFGPLSPALVNAVRKGAGLRLVAGREIASESCGGTGTLYVNGRLFAAGFTSLEMLKGKRVSLLTVGGTSEFYLDAILASAGLSSADVTLVTLNPEQGVVALVKGNIDALISSEFDKSLDAVWGEVVKAGSLAESMPGFQYSFIFFGTRLLTEERESGIRFLTAYLQGSRAFLQGETPEFLHRLARAHRLDPEKVAKDCRGTFLADGKIDRKSVETYIDWLVKKGYCDPIQADQIVCERAILQAQSRLAG
jgi:NitT/TauT family transport system substrate-binding protein